MSVCPCILTCRSCGQSPGASVPLELLHHLLELFWDYCKTDLFIHQFLTVGVLHNALFHLSWLMIPKDNVHSLPFCFFLWHTLSNSFNEIFLTSLFIQPCRPKNILHVPLSDYDAVPFWIINYIPHFGSHWLEHSSLLFKNLCFLYLTIPLLPAMSKGVDKHEKMASSGYRTVSSVLWKASAKKS